MFSGTEGCQVSSAGTDDDAECPVSADLIEWADEIYVMEQHHKASLASRFGRALSDKRLVVLGIPDRFEYMDPELVRLLKKKMGPWLAGVGAEHTEADSEAEQHWEEA